MGGAILYAVFLAVAALRSWKACMLTGLRALDRALILATLGMTVAVAVGSIAENIYGSTITWWFYMAILGCTLAVTSERFSARQSAPRHKLVDPAC